MCVKTTRTITKVGKDAMRVDITHSGAHSTPWTFRVFNKLPGNPAFIGVFLAGVLLTMYLIGRVSSVAGVDSNAADFRLAIIHILLTAYAVFAYVYLLSSTIKVNQDLTAFLGDEQERQVILSRVGKHLWWGMLLAGLCGLFVDILATNVTTIGSDPWDWRQNNYDSFWMRVLGPLMCWWVSSLLYVMIVESFRLSALSDKITSLDLLDLSPYKPLIRQGLTNALLVLGVSSILSLFLLESGYVWFMTQVLVVLAVFAWIGLMLPLRGVRSKISQAKTAELLWCQGALQAARRQLKKQAEQQQSVAEIIAYRSVIEGVRNWPFDSPTLARFALYLLIPIGSMVGGAFVERGLDLFLD